MTVISQVMMNVVIAVLLVTEISALAPATPARSQRRPDRQTLTPIISEGMTKTCSVGFGSQEGLSIAEEFGMVML